ncbi:hypothetical protein B0H14DRAFT_3134946 [Mycena olivaceomarginata]|nr:hypothetical protein B0H14DRAFT_3134946 [Mycena olivaceomarginata]
MPDARKQELGPALHGATGALTVTKSGREAEKSRARPRRVVAIVAGMDMGRKAASTESFPRDAVKHGERRHHAGEAAVEDPPLARTAPPAFRQRNAQQEYAFSSKPPEYELTSHPANPTALESANVESSSAAAPTPSRPPPTDCSSSGHVIHTDLVMTVVLAAALAQITLRDEGRAEYTDDDQGDSAEHGYVEGREGRIGRTAWSACDQGPPRARAFSSLLCSRGGTDAGAAEKSVLHQAVGVGKETRDDLYAPAIGASDGGRGGDALLAPRASGHVWSSCLETLAPALDKKQARTHYLEGVELFFRELAVRNELQLCRPPLFYGSPVVSEYYGRGDTSLRPSMIDQPAIKSAHKKEKSRDDILESPANAIGHGQNQVAVQAFRQRLECRMASVGSRVLQRRT